MTAPPHPATARAVHQIPEIAQAIQLAIAPVFLLTAIGAILGVVTSRLARTVDRARELEARFADTPEAGRAALSAVLAVLDRRMVLANRAVSLCVLSAFLTCVLIATLFLSAVLDFPVEQALPALFIMAMGVLIAGLAAFLLEVRIATRTLRVTAELIRGAPRAPGDILHFEI